jgi:hypothetical protein
MSTSPLPGTVSSRYGAVHYLRGVSAQSVRVTYGPADAEVAVDTKRVTVSGR